MRAFVVCGAIAVAFAVHSAQAMPADEPTNLSAQVAPAIDLETEDLFTGPVPTGRTFMLPLFVARTRLPSDPEGTPVSTIGDRSATYDVELPEGFEVQPAREVRAAGYRGLSSTCTSACRIVVPHGELTAVAVLLVRASTPGTHAVTMRLTSTSHPDPDPGNDAYTKEIRVAVAIVTAGRAFATPRVPRAGRTFALTLPLTVSGVPVTPASVRCSAVVRTLSLRSAPSRAAGRARCSWKIPPGAAGHTLRAKLFAVAGGKTFSAARTARVR